MGDPLTPEENEYEIASLEELYGTLLPTLTWQYGRQRDHYVAKRALENQFYYDWLDVMLRLEGKIVNQLQIYFLSTFRWQSGRVAQPNQTKREIRQRYFPPSNANAGKQKAKLLANLPAPSGVAALFPGTGFAFPEEDARRHEYKALKRAGLGLLIYPRGLHGKLYIQDARFSNVGSFNIFLPNHFTF